MFFLSRFIHRRGTCNICNILIKTRFYKKIYFTLQAYKNFGTRINNLRKRLEDLVKSLPSPVPSPSRDAPSPGNTPPEDTLDNIESVDMDLDDEASNSIIRKFY